MYKIKFCIRQDREINVDQTKKAKNSIMQSNEKNVY